MVVFYTCSYYGKSKYQKQYDLVRQTIKDLRVELIATEEGNYLDVLDESTKKKVTDPKLLHYEAIRQGIHLADCVIIEISQEDFQLGHEATLTIMEKKPVLCLSIHEDFSQKINNPYFFAAKYNEKNIHAIIQDFFARVRELRHAKRFNMFFYPNQLHYLEKISQKRGMNVSEYIRHLVNLDHHSSQSEPVDA